MVDRSALKTNQASIVVLLLAAFILDVPALVALVALAMIVGTAWPAAGPFRLLYLHVLRPAGSCAPTRSRKTPRRTGSRWEWAPDAWSSR